MNLRFYLIPICVLGTAHLDAQQRESPKPSPSAIFSQRATPELREKARVTAGFPANTQAAVDKTLHYLAGQQNKDGSWGEQKKIETTSLALLAFLGNGESPLSENHGEGITRGIMFLVDVSVKNRARLCSTPRKPHPLWPLEHALATQALAEGYLVCSRLGVSLPGLADQTQVAAQTIIDGDTQGGGWALQFAEQSQRGAEMDLTAPLLHALWLAHLTGVETRNMKTAVQKALIAIARRQIDSGEVPNHTFPMTGGVAFAFRIAGRPKHDVARDAHQFVTHSPAYRYRGLPIDSNLLTLHYDALAVHNVDGKSWEKWFTPRINELLKNQHASGQFNPQLDKLSTHPIQESVRRSALACLILETPWRYQLKE